MDRLQLVSHSPPPQEINQSRTPKNYPFDVLSGKTLVSEDEAFALWTSITEIPSFLHIDRGITGYAGTISGGNFTNILGVTQLVDCLSQFWGSLHFHDFNFDQMPLDGWRDFLASLQNCDGLASLAFINCKLDQNHVDYISFRSGSFTHLQSLTIKNSPGIFSPQFINQLMVRSDTQTPLAIRLEETSITAESIAAWRGHATKPPTHAINVQLICPTTDQSVDSAKGILAEIQNDALLQVVIKHPFITAVRRNQNLEVTTLFRPYIEEQTVPNFGERIARLEAVGLGIRFFDSAVPTFNIKDLNIIKPDGKTNFVLTKDIARFFEPLLKSLHPVDASHESLFVNSFNPLQVFIFEESDVLNAPANTKPLDLPYKRIMRAQNTHVVLYLLRIIVGDQCKFLLMSSDHLPHNAFKPSLIDDKMDATPSNA